MIFEPMEKGPGGLLQQVPRHVQPRSPPSWALGRRNRSPSEVSSVVSAARIAATSATPAAWAESWALRGAPNPRLEKVLVGGRSVESAPWRRPNAASASTAAAILSPRKEPRRRILHQPAVGGAKALLAPEGEACLFGDKPLPPGAGNPRLISTYQGLTGMRNMGSMRSSGELDTTIPESMFAPVTRFASGSVVETAVSCEAPEWWVGCRLGAVGGKKSQAPGTGENKDLVAIGQGTTSMMRALDQDGNGDFDEVAEMLKPENRVKGNNFDHWKRDEPQLFVPGEIYKKNVKQGRKCLHGYYLCDYHPCATGGGGRDEVSNLEHGLVAPLPKHPAERGVEKSHRVKESMINTHLIPRHYYGTGDPLPH